MPFALGHVLFRSVLRGSAGFLALPLTSLTPICHPTFRGTFRRPLSTGKMSSLSEKMGGDTATANNVKPNIVFVLGAPGSGKGTQCSLIVRDLDFVHLSAGDLLRIERDTVGSQHGEMILSHMKNGTIVPVAVTCSLLENAIKTSGKLNFLVDGFPRNQDNLQGWIKEMGDKTNLMFVLFLEAPEDMCVKRILSRAATSGRPDDNVESLKKRFQTYINDTLPIINYYSQLGLVRKVDSTRPPEVVHAEIAKILQVTQKNASNLAAGEPVKHA